MYGVAKTETALPHSLMTAGAGMDKHINNPTAFFLIRILIEKIVFYLSF
jgi:hypothetical protein